MSSNITHRFNEDMKCWFCGRPYTLHLHHIFYGNANRKISEKNGFTTYLCQEHHTGLNGVHKNIENDLKLKRACEQWYLDKGHSKEDFIKLIGHNYL